VEYEHAYSTYGNPADPPIVLIHGIRLGRQMWEPHARVLAARYFVVTVDLPGHGALIGMPFNAQTTGAVFDEIYTGVCGRPPLIVGYSLGGYASMVYAEHHPRRSRALLLVNHSVAISTSAGFPPSGSAPMAACWRGRRGG